MNAHKHIACLVASVCTLLLIAQGAESVHAQINTPLRHDKIELLAPFSDPEITITSGTANVENLPWIAYFISTRKILYITAAGFCVLWVLISGVQIMVSGDQSGKRDEAIGRIKASILGLVILLFAGPVLNFLNALFFTPT